MFLSLIIYRYLKYRYYQQHYNQQKTLLLLFLTLLFSMLLIVEFFEILPNHSIYGFISESFALN